MNPAPLVISSFIFASEWVPKEVTLTFKCKCTYFGGVGGSKAKIILTNS